LKGGAAGAEVLDMKLVAPRTRPTHIGAPRAHRPAPPLTFSCLGGFTFAIVTLGVLRSGIAATIHATIT
jgi:hypothetical protein